MKFTFKKPGVVRAAARGVILFFPLFVVPAFLGIWLLDSFLLYLNNASNLPALGITESKLALNSLDLYPYDGWHVQANFHQKGPMPPWPNLNFDITSGPQGFFVNFDPHNPPPKAQNEYRIFLIGGSRAQGFGATTNSKMMYRLLEEKLNRFIRPITRLNYRVINFAMASSITYQNFIALNQWGHRLDPDMILSYSGVNDFTVPITSEMANSFFQFSQLNALVLATHGTNTSPSSDFLYKLFPNIMRQTNLGVALKIALDLNYFNRLASAKYQKDTGVSGLTPKGLMEQVALPAYVDALKSIKRDFRGIPIAIVWQAMAQTEIATFQKLLSSDFYDAMFNKSKSSLEHYMNDKWVFANFYAKTQQLTGDCTAKNSCIAVHSADEGQEITANFIASTLRPYLLGEHASEQSVVEGLGLEAFGNARISAPEVLPDTSMIFDGNGYVVIKNADVFPCGPLSPCVIALDVKFDKAVPSEPAGLLIGQSYFGHPGWHLLHTAGQLLIQRDGGSDQLAVKWKPPRDHFVHVEVRFDGIVLSLWADGEKLGQAKLQPFISTKQEITLGGRPGNVPIHFVGEIRNVKILAGN